MNWHKASRLGSRLTSQLDAGLNSHICHSEQSEESDFHQLIIANTSEAIQSRLSLRGRSPRQTHLVYELYLKILPDR